MKVYDPVGDIRRQLDLADLIPDPATDPVFMAAARAAVIAGGNIPWSDLEEKRRKAKQAGSPQDQPKFD